jgi:excisionase family DNA binding protein
MLNVHISTLRRWSDGGMLRVYRIGTRGDRRFSRKDILDFMTRQTLRHAGPANLKRGGRTA